MSDSQRAILCSSNPEVFTLPVSQIKIQNVKGTNWVQNLSVPPQQLTPAVLANGTLYTVVGKPENTHNASGQL